MYSSPFLAPKINVLIPFSSPGGFMHLGFVIAFDGGNEIDPATIFSFPVITEFLGQGVWSYEEATSTARNGTGTAP
jgi:hypothetical protein